MKLRTYIYMGIALLIAALGLALAVTIDGKRKAEKKWMVAEENVKSYGEQYSASESKNRAFKLTIDQLRSSKDSIFEELNATRKELKVRDSKLQSLQYVSSSFARKDTIVLRDTIFRDGKVDVDTTLSDEWYSMRIGLRYPSTIAVRPEFRSVKSIVVSSKRETVNAPKRFFLFRWFQKRHTVLNIDVVERNPYVRDENNRYVEIVR